VSAPRALRRSILVAALLLAFAPTARPAHGAADATGIVRTTLRPVAGAHVLLPALGAYATTDSAGRFRLRGLPAGTHDLRIAIVGFAPVEGAITIGAVADSAGGTVDAGAWLLAPLRPDDQPLHLKEPAKAPAPIAPPRVEAIDARVPGPAPLSPTATLFRTSGEIERWPAPARLLPASDGPRSTGEAFADLLRRVAVADSITAATGGTGAPGFETWRQWGDRFELFAGDSARALDRRLVADSSLVLRSAAYARTRAALAAGPTRAGYALATAARLAVGRARRAGGREDAAFLGFLGQELDRVFVPGSAPPPPPKAAPRKRGKRRR
jgi:hypothetical protein